MSKLIDYTLPEFVFLDANCHTGNALDGRTVMQHVRSATILEVVALDELLAHSFTQPTYEFEYENKVGIIERHMFVVHFSLMVELGEPDEGGMHQVFQTCEKWYCDYLAWEDGNIDKDDKSVKN